VHNVYLSIAFYYDLMIKTVPDSTKENLRVSTVTVFMANIYWRDFQGKDVENIAQLVNRT